MKDIVSFECPSCGHTISYEVPGEYSWPICPNECGVTDAQVTATESRVWNQVIDYFKTYEDGGWALLNIEYEAKRQGYIE